MRQVGIRLSAGFDYTGIAVMLEANRGHLKHVELPTGPITTGWIAARMKDLRREIAETHLDTQV